MAKEIITKNNIKSELKYYYKSRLIGNLYMVLFALGVWWLLLGPITLLGVYPISLISYPTVFLLIIAAFICLNFFINIRKVDKKPIRITSDEMMNAEKSHHNFLVRGPSDIPTTIYFKSHEKYSAYSFCGIIFKRQYYYNCTNNMRMTSDGLYNTSLIGDEFYIVSFDCINPILIYNKKLFEFID